MKRFPLLIGGILGGLTALVLAVFSELISALFGLPGIAFTLFDWMARHLPGPLITLFIGTMVKTINLLNLGPTAVVAKRIEQGSAIVVFAVIGAIFGLTLAAFARRRPAQLGEFGFWGGLILLIPMLAVLLTLAGQANGSLLGVIWWGILFLGWGWILGKLIEYLAWPQESGVPDASRRKFLYLVGAGSFTILVSAAGVSLIPQNPSIPSTGTASGPGAEPSANSSTTSGPAKSPPDSALNARFKPVPGTRPELTSNQDFYRIDINTVPPRVDAAKWRLEIKGLVNRPLQLTLDEIKNAQPVISQAATLECISNEVGGDLTSTAIWTGTRLKDILAKAGGMKPGAKEVYITAADGYYESVVMSDVMDDRTLLVYEMNGQPLAVEHGFPLRIYIPNHFGMKQPKWITSLEVIDHQATGYWVERGWNIEAIPPTTSVIDAIDAEGFDPQTGLLPVGGIAYAGARGISKVEVQVDEGPWAEAELRTPALSPLTWVQWRYSWKSQIGQHTFRVRAYDGARQLQSDVPAPPEPDGATGIDTKTAILTQGGK